MIQKSAGHIRVVSGVFFICAASACRFFTGEMKACFAPRAGAKKKNAAKVPPKDTCFFRVRAPATKWGSCFLRLRCWQAEMGDLLPEVRSGDDLV